MLQVHYSASNIAGKSVYSYEITILPYNAHSSGQARGRVKVHGRRTVDGHQYRIRKQKQPKTVKSTGPWDLSNDWYNGFVIAS
jgi:hypothetical protein